jgi:Family of unknown function (DUF5678)
MSTVTVENIVELINQLPALERGKLINELTRSGKSQLPKSRIISVNSEYDDRSLDYDWLAKHRSAYIGQWVALKDGQLVASGEKAKEVFAKAEQLGCVDPLVLLVEDPDIPFVNI